MTRPTTGIAVIESKWWRRSNISVRGLFDLVSDIAVHTPHGYHYEMANSELALKEAIPRIATYPDCRYLCLAMHGDEKGLCLLDDQRLSRSELRNLMRQIDGSDRAKLHGLHLSSCQFGTQEAAAYILGGCTKLGWIAGYSKEVNWIDSSALDLLFFNNLLFFKVATEAQRIRAVAGELTNVAHGLVEQLGFGIFVRTKGQRGVQNLLALSEAEGA